MSRLLAAERRPGTQHLVDHVLVADRRASQQDSLLLQGRVKAQVGHHCRHHEIFVQQVAPLEGDRSREENVVAIEAVAPLVDEEAPIRVSVQGRAEVSSAGDHFLGESLHVQRPAILIDVPPVGIASDVLHIGTQSLEGQRSDLGRRSVGAIDHEPQVPRRRRRTAGSQ